MTCVARLGNRLAHHEPANQQVQRIQVLGAIEQQGKILLMAARQQVGLKTVAARPPGVNSTSRR